MTLKLQPAVRGGDQTRKVSFFIAKAFRLCPPHFACTAYLEPNSDSMQKPIGGGGLPETIGDRCAIGAFHNQKHDKKSIRNASVRTIYSFYIKGGIDKKSHNSTSPFHFTFPSRNVLSNNSIVTPSSPEATVNHKGVKPIKPNAPKTSLTNSDAAMFCFAMPMVFSLSLTR